MSMSKHEYISKITEVVASKSTCARAKVGAVFINDDHEILSTGYNGAPRGLPSCDDTGHLLDKDDHCIRTTHAEQNAIVQAAKRGVKLKESTLYCTHSPCLICTKLLINLGVKEIKYKKFYRDELSIHWLEDSNIKVSKW